MNIKLKDTIPCRHKFFAIILLLNYLLLSCGAKPELWFDSKYSSRSVIEVLRNEDKVLRLPSAHRGFHLEYFDNSKGALLSAVKIGVPLIEVDLRRNSEGTVFLFHDNLVSTSNCSAPTNLIGRSPESLSNSELESMRLGRKGNTKILRFEGALEAIRPYNVALQLDLKLIENEQVIESILKKALNSGQFNKVIVQINKPDTLKRLRGKYPNLALLARIHVNSELDQVLQSQPEIVQIDYEIANSEVINRIHASKSRVLIKSLSEEADTPSQWKVLFNLGVDIILTDRPDEMIAFINSSLSNESGPV